MEKASQEQMAHAIAQLRHAYKQLMAGEVIDQAEFAQGLIAPAIATLEGVMTSVLHDLDLPYEEPTVPVTEAMATAGEDRLQECLEAGVTLAYAVSEVYRAMIAAQPQCSSHSCLVSESTLRVCLNKSSLRENGQQYF